MPLQMKHYLIYSSLLNAKKTPQKRRKRSNQKNENNFVIAIFYKFQNDHVISNATLTWFTSFTLFSSYLMYWYDTWKKARKKQTVPLVPWFCSPKKEYTNLKKSASPYFCFLGSFILFANLVFTLLNLYWNKSPLYFVVFKTNWLHEWNDGAKFRYKKLFPQRLSLSLSPILTMKTKIVFLSFCSMFRFFLTINALHYFDFLAGSLKLLNAPFFSPGLFLFSRRITQNKFLFI